MLHERRDTACLKDQMCPTPPHLMTAAAAAAAADAFDLSSAVKQVHSRFNNSAKRPHEIDRYAARLSTAA